MSDVAKVFRTGRSQAVRLPLAYRFDTAEVYVRRDEITGDVILSRRPADWSELMAAIDRSKLEAVGFLEDRVDPPAAPRKLF